jgi:hypothetical protein
MGIFLEKLGTISSPEFTEAQGSYTTKTTLLASQK